LAVGALPQTSLGAYSTSQTHRWIWRDEERGIMEGETGGKRANDGEVGERERRGKESREWEWTRPSSGGN